MPVLVFMLHFISVDNIAKISFGLSLIKAFVLVIIFSKITIIKIWHTCNHRDAGSSLKQQGGKLWGEINFLH